MRLRSRLSCDLPIKKLDVKKYEQRRAKVWDDGSFSLLIRVGSDGRRELSIR